MFGKQGWPWPRVEEAEPFKTNPTTVGGSGRRVQFLHGTLAHENSGWQKSTQSLVRGMQSFDKKR